MHNPEKFWDRVAYRFEKRSGKFDRTETRTFENTKRYLHADDIVLDYGCGTGTMAITISNRVKMIHGMDISQNMIAAAKRKATEQDLQNIHFAQSTIFDDSYNKGSFHVILAFNILHFIKDTGGVLNRINDLLKPEGLLISVTPCLKEGRSFANILVFLLVFCQNKMGMLPYSRFFRIQELKNSIVNANFQIVDTELLQGPGEPYFIVAKKR